MHRYRRHCEYIYYVMFITANKFSSSSSSSSSSVNDAETWLEKDSEKPMKNATGHIIVWRPIPLYTVITVMLRGTSTSK